MKINEVLECVNKVLDQDRAVNNIECNGHLVAHTSWEKKIGTAKEFHVYIDYVNGDQTYKYISKHHICQCPADEVDSMKNQVELMALELLFKAFRFGVGVCSYDSLMRGEYKGWS